MWLTPMVHPVVITQSNVYMEWILLLGALGPCDAEKVKQISSLPIRRQLQKSLVKMSVQSVASTSDTMALRCLPFVLSPRSLLLNA